MSPCPPFVVSGRRLLFLVESSASPKPPAFKATYQSMPVDVTKGAKAAWGVDLGSLRIPAVAGQRQFV